MHIADQRDAEKAATYFEPFIRHFHASSRILDVASGRGHLLQALKQAGLRAEGMELDTDLCNVTRSRGLSVIEGDFFELLKSVPIGTYDGAIASHIVEHFAPAQVEELLTLLRPVVTINSPLLILTPNIANIRRAVGDFWRDPTHVRPYPISALHKLLRRTGWEMVDSGEHTDRSPSLGRAISYAIRNLLIGRYWVGDDLFVIARRAH